MWKRSGPALYTKLDLATVKGIVVGPRTKPFAKYDWKAGKPWHCFSLLTESRSVDVECASKEQFNLWYWGLMDLIPLSSQNLSKPEVQWRIALFKTIQISQRCKLPVQEVWHKLVRQARTDLQSPATAPSSSSTSSNTLSPQFAYVVWSVSKS
eukprot:TRINITY_DN523_c0_g1_i2.p2 TRINITY_DN523_c0_g1~~TRINITY_DN523_c0_g1_i2.p2  ORF type:complete len:153 (-),score=28.88 TRINITY_DN523_c0_g1_i2:61-519(-)